MILETVTVGPYEVNCYIVAQAVDSEAILIDSGAEQTKIKRVINKFKLTPALIINTHGHIDHIGCDDLFDVPVYVHRLDLALLRDSDLNLSAFLASPFSVKAEMRALEDKEHIDTAGIRLQVIHVPGHTPGGIALLMEKPENNILFTGDSLFYQGIGRTDFPYGDETALLRSIHERLLTLPDETVIFPGHGPSSTIGEEKKNNPYARID